MSKIKQGPKGIRLDSVPDVTARRRDRDDDAADRARLSARILRREPEETVTAERLELERANRTCVELLTDPAVLASLATMVTMRQGYAVAAQRLSELVSNARDAAEKAGKDFSPLVEDYLYQLGVYEAAKSFDINGFVHALARNSLSFFGEVADALNSAEANARREDAADAAAARAATKIPLGFRHDAFCEDELLPRDRTLVLVGLREAAYWLLGRIAAAVEAHNAREDSYPLTAVRFTSRAAVSPEEQSSVLLRLPASAARGCANANKTLARVMGEYVADRQSAQLDLLVFEDLPATFTAGLAGAPPAAAAGNGHRNIRRWCDAAGCALVGVVPTDEDAPPDISSPAWEALKTHTSLCLLGVVRHGDPGGPAEGLVRVVVGNNARTFDVPEEELAAFAGGRVLVA